MTYESLAEDSFNPSPENIKKALNVAPVDLICDHDDEHFYARNVSDHSEICLPLDTYPSFLDDTNEWNSRRFQHGNASASMNPVKWAGWIEEHENI